jgi:glycerophosphoryl diester phosphodiesterase
MRPDLVIARRSRTRSKGGAEPMTHRRLWLATALAAFGSLLVVDTAQAATCIQVPIAAHRGAPVAASGNTENGVRAFRAAISNGATAVEADFRRTRDHEILVMHDKTLDRTTSCTGYLSRKTYKQAVACRLEDGERMPGLKTMLSLLRSTGAVGLFELKNLGPRAMRHYVDILRSYSDLKDQVVINSLSASQLASFRSYAGKRWATAFIVQPGTDPALNLPFAKLYGPHAELMTHSDFGAYENKGLTLTVGGTGASQWSRAASYQEDQLLTNDVLGYRQWVSDGCNASTQPKDYPYSTTWTD